MTRRNILFYERIVNLADRFLDVLFPPDYRCYCCSSEIQSGKKICIDCEKKLIKNLKYCKCCALPIHSMSDYCLACKKKPMKDTTFFAPFIFDGSARKLIYNLKIKNIRSMAEFMGEKIAEFIMSENITFDFITFVPMTKREKARKGFNQSELIAKEVAKRTKKPFYSALIKVRETDRQVGLSVCERKENLTGAFAANKQILGKKVLLVDDVITTGSTMREACAALFAGGAKFVYCAAFARTDGN